MQLRQATALSLAKTIARDTRLRPQKEHSTRRGNGESAIFRPIRLAAAATHSLQTKTPGPPTSLATAGLERLQKAQAGRTDEMLGFTFLLRAHRASSSSFSTCDRSCSSLLLLRSVRATSRLLMAPSKSWRPIDSSQSCSCIRTLACRLLMLHSLRLAAY